MAQRIKKYQQKLSNIELQRYTAKKGTPRAQLNNLVKNQSVFSQNQQHLNLPKPNSVHRISNASNVVKRGGRCTVSEPRSLTAPVHPQGVVRM